MHCCNNAKPVTPAIAGPSAPPLGSPRNSPLHRVATFISWALPIITLALVPKCPACIAAYVLLLTGIGLSFPAATAARWLLIALSIAALAWLAGRRGLNWPRTLPLSDSGS